jgi:hypothetical protein
MRWWCSRCRIERPGWGERWKPASPAARMMQDRDARLRVHATVRRGPTRQPSIIAQKVPVFSGSGHYVADRGEAMQSCSEPR